MRLYNSPTTILGTTGYGKSYYAKNTLKKEGCGVLYYNTICDNADMRGWTKADGSIDFTDLIKALDKGEKINYQAIKNVEIREMELQYILGKLQSRQNKTFILAVDEVHLFEDKDTRRLMKNISQVGRHFGIIPVWISQRPQQMDRALITQTSTKIIFYTEMEDSYFKSYGIDVEKMKKEIAGRKYYYVEIRAGQGMSSAKKI
jgi:KaiC/GvpD/RAD55 family RecA-like ATPase